MHNILGIVKVVVGQVFAIAVDGTQRELHEGDRIFAGEEIVTSASGALTVNLYDGHTMDIHLHQPSGPDLGSDKGQHVDDRVNLSDLAQELEHGTDITSLIKRAGHSGSESTVIDSKAHVAPAMISESAGMDSFQHSSFDHLLHKPEHQY